MLSEAGLVAILIGNALALLLWYLNRGEQNAKIYKSQQETISRALDDIEQLRQEIKQIHKERDELARGVLILTRQLVNANIIPDWIPPRNGKNSVK